MVKTHFNFSNKTITINGYSKDDWIFSSIATNKTFYEVDLLKYMRFALSQQTGHILDIGANIGNHSVFFGKIMNLNVLCFEPNPPIFQILEENLSTNNVKYKAYCIGLGAHSGQYSIDDTHAAAEGNIGAAKLFASSNGQIIVKTLDKVLEIGVDDCSRIIAIKADIEGMEAEMLKGGIETLKTYKPDLFLEINDESLMQEIESIIYPLGYKKLYAFAGTPVWHFSHSSKLSIRQKYRLWTYYKAIKGKSLIGRFIRVLKYK